MSRAMNDHFIRSSEGARHTRHKISLDCLERSLKRRETHERWLFIGSSFLLAAVLAVCYTILIT
jgi:hypothetical protein